MNLVQVAVLALIQAFTEFLPVSSSAHLVISRWLLGWDDPGLFFDIALHVGTLIALLAYFSKTWVRILALAVGRPILVPESGHPDHDLYQNPHLLYSMAVATIPAALAGLMLQEIIETSFRNPQVISVMLIAVGLVIWGAEKKGGLRAGLDTLSFSKVLLVGCAQAVALIPGTSRSGITIAAGLLLGLNRQAAARFSFLLGMPVILGAACKTGLEIFSAPPPDPQMYTSLIAGILISAVAGYTVIAMFLRYLQNSTMLPFVYYRLGLGLIILIIVSNFPVVAFSG